MRFLGRWARFAHRRRWYVIGAWALALSALVVGWNTSGGAYSNNFKLPGSEAIAAEDLLQQRFPQASGESSDVAIRASASINTPAVQQRVETLVAQLRAIPRSSPSTLPTTSPAQSRATGPSPGRRSTGRSRPGT